MGRAVRDPAAEGRNIVINAEPRRMVAP